MVDVNVKGVNAVTLKSFSDCIFFTVCTYWVFRLYN